MDLSWPRWMSDRFAHFVFIFGLGNFDGRKLEVILIQYNALILDLLEQKHVAKVSIEGP